MACTALFSGYAAADPVSFEGLNYEIDKSLKTAAVVAGVYAGDISIPETITVEGVAYDVKTNEKDALKQQSINASSG